MFAKYALIVVIISLILKYIFYVDRMLPVQVHKLWTRLYKYGIVN